MGNSTLLSVSVIPGANPDSSNLAVTADLSSIGGSSAQVFAGNGNTFTFNAAVPDATAPGLKSLPVTITDGESRTGTTSIALTVLAATDAAPTIAGVTPLDGASAVPVNSNVTVAFSEPVTASSAFSLTCGGTAQPFAVSNTGNTFTIDPSSDLPYATGCTVLVTGSNVHDTDTDDPPDTMAGNVSWTFTTENPPAQSAATS